MEGGYNSFKPLKKSAKCFTACLAVVLGVIRISTGTDPISHASVGWVGINYVWFGLVWFGLVWFGLVWFGLVWFDGFHCFFACEGGREVIPGNCTLTENGSPALFNELFYCCDIRKRGGGRSAGDEYPRADEILPEPCMHGVQHPLTFVP